MTSFQYFHLGLLRYLALLVWLLALAIQAQIQGSGIPKIKFDPIQVGKPIFTFPPETHRLEEAIMHNGYLIYTGKESENLWIWDLKDPSKPDLVSKLAGGSGNVHALPVMGDILIVQGLAIDLSDTRQPKILGALRGGWDPGNGLWEAVQYPYMYTTTTYLTGGSTGLHINDYSDPLNPKRIKTINTQAQVGFPTGTTHLIGNLMVLTSGDEYKGVSTWDISDPLNPKLLDSRNDGQPIYFGQVYGNKIITVGPAEKGKVAIFDFSDPLNIKLEWEGELETSDYQRFQNGILYGACNDWQTGNYYVGYDVKTRQQVRRGQSAGGRYVMPLGNLIWTGSPTGDAGLSVMAAEPDSEGPSVLSVNPPNGALNQALGSRLGICLNENADNRSLNIQNMQLREVGGVPVEGWFAQTHGIVNFTPKANLKANTTYQVVLPKGGLKDWSGNGSPAEFYSAFSTGSNLVVTILGTSPKTFQLRAGRSRQNESWFIAPRSNRPGFGALPIILGRYPAWR